MITLLPFYEFQSTSSVWRTTIGCREVSGTSKISIHVLRVEDDWILSRCKGDLSYFNPRPPCGGRRLSAYFHQRQSYFNPRPPCGGRLLVESITADPCSISIHVLRVEDDPADITTHHSIFISIHVLRVEDDFVREVSACGGGISIHVLRVEDDFSLPVWLRSSVIFQSTSSVWRTTVAFCWCNLTAKFQSTSSVWRTTWEPQTFDFAFVISIHVLRVEDDHSLINCNNILSNFNPRPPCGGRLGFACGAG